MNHKEDHRPNDSPWMTVEQLADYLSVSPGTIRNWVSQRYVPYAKKGRMVRFHRQKIDTWLAADSCLGRRAIAQDILPKGQTPS